MPSDASASAAATPHLPLTGRCFCGAVTLAAARGPGTVAYCHCSDCCRWTGAPLPAFAAFAVDDLQATPDLGRHFRVVAGVDRWVCDTCGSPIAARFDYLPGQIYVPHGLLDQADRLPPQIHCHAGSQLPWLHIEDTLERAPASGRDSLNARL